MKTNYVLIDYENVQPEVAEALSPAIFTVIVFVGAQQHKVKYDLVELIQRKGVGARCIKVSATARNALDFHMAYYLGQLAKDEPDAFFHLIAKDAGMDPLIQHLQGNGIQAFRRESVFDIQLVKAPSNTAEDDKLSHIIDYLIRRGAQRPASLKTLHGSVSALFSPKLATEETAALVEKLRVNGVFELAGARLLYGLPDGA